LGDWVKAKKWTDLSDLDVFCGVAFRGRDDCTRIEIFSGVNFFTSRL